jgi:cell division protein FtsZ
MRMPQIEDLPQVAQNQLRAMREAAPATPVPETRRRSLLEKLAAFGINRHDDEPAPGQLPPAQPAPPAPAPQRLYAAPPPHAEVPRAPPRPIPSRAASGALDPHGRQIPRPPVTEDDHLDIPAFLRRQPH